MTRRVHRVLGVAMTVPLLAWAATGLLFFLKPGWSEAYASLEVPRRPLDGATAPALAGPWLEARLVRTVLGDHLLVRTEEGGRHLDPATGADRPLPGLPEVRRLLEEAVATDRGRYGHVETIEASDADTIVATTDRGVRLSLDWPTLLLSQEGADTRRIDALYRVHYLQWTGIAAVDRALGVAGLAGIVTLAGLGLRLSWNPRKRQIQA